VVGFTAPAAWPKALTQKWKVTVGDGVSSPALVGDKVYVFTRQGDDEVIWCLNAGDGKEVWKDKYAAEAVTNNARSFPGPRSSPGVGNGKVCTLGVGGVVSCLDAATGKVAWRHDTKAKPQFYTSTSPLIVDGKCIVYVGGGRGELTAFDLASGEAKWKWTGEGPGYGSPVLMTVEGTRQVVTQNQQNLIAVDLSDGKLLWQIGLKVGGIRPALRSSTGRT
jgi:outer membrane protein assembly factor BamB